MSGMGGGSSGTNAMIDLMAVIANPEVHKSRLDELIKREVSAQAAIEQSRAEQAKLDATLRVVNEKLAAQEKRTKELLIEEQHMSEQRKELGELGESLTKRENDAAVKEHWIGQQTSKAIARTQELDKREQALDQKSHDLDQREADVRVGERDLHDQRAQLRAEMNETARRLSAAV